MRRLEDELKITREELQSTIEELQSSNEELETSKEELQSLNEELTTVNNQLQNKVVEVESTSNDLSNLLSSSNVATLFLDRELRIKRFTPATTKLMNLIPADVGRPVTDIASKYADQRKNEFLAMLGHELRNPLAPIQNAVDVLALQKGLPEKVRWAADVIRRQSEQLEQLVNDLLDVSRITRGDIQLKKQAVAVQECLENALLNVAHLVEKAHHRVETRLLEEPVVVMGDSVRLTQVFTNLLSNAIRYTPDRGHILIALAQEAGKAVVRVRDNGEGIRFEDMEGLFDLFSRVHREHDGCGGADGLGLGLTLARRLIEQHGGVLEGHSDGPGKGSEFLTTLPICSEIAQAGSPSGRESTLKAEPRARRILVVDDEAIISMSLQVLLESMGHRVRTLNTGREAITVIWDFHPEVVFLDIGMPDMNGFEVAISIRSATLDSQPLFVAVTGYGGDSDRAEAKKAGFDQFLLKPLARERIETLLDELGERSSAIHTNTLRNASSDEAQSAAGSRFQLSG